MSGRRLCCRACLRRVCKPQFTMLAQSPQWFTEALTVREGANGSFGKADRYCLQRLQQLPTSYPSLRPLLATMSSQNIQPALAAPPIPTASASSTTPSTPPTPSTTSTTSTPSTQSTPSVTSQFRLPNPSLLSTYKGPSTTPPRFVCHCQQARASADAGPAHVTTSRTRSLSLSTTARSAKSIVLFMGF